MRTEAEIEADQKAAIEREDWEEVSRLGQESRDAHYARLDAEGAPKVPALTPWDLREMRRIMTLPEEERPTIACVQSPFGLFTKIDGQWCCTSDGAMFDNNGYLMHYQRDLRGA